MLFTNIQQYASDSEWTSPTIRLYNKRNIKNYNNIYKLGYKNEKSYVIKANNINKLEKGSSCLVIIFSPTTLLFSLNPIKATLLLNLYFNTYIFVQVFYHTIHE